MSNYFFNLISTAGVEQIASRAKTQEAAHRAVREMVRKYDMGGIDTVEITDGSETLETFNLAVDGWDYTVHNAEEAWAGCTGANAWRTFRIAVRLDEAALVAA
jgi:hypothetical protein